MIRKGLTRGSLRSRGSACEITAPLSLTLLLEIAVDSIIAVILYSVRTVTGTTLKDRRTVSSSSTSIIQCLLKDLITHPVLAYAVNSTCRRKLKIKKRKRDY